MKVAMLTMGECVVGVLVRHSPSPPPSEPMCTTLYFVLETVSKMLVSCPAHMHLLVRNGLVNKVELVSKVKFLGIIPEM